MTATDATYKVGDTRPFLDATLKDANGPVDLSTGLVDNVRFVLEDQDANEIVNESSTGANVSITDSTGGKVRYKWQVADLSSEGNYYAEWKVTFGDGTVARFPNTRHVHLTVKPGLST